MALGKTVTFRFEGATWGDLRSFVRHADEMGVSDTDEVELAYEGDGEREEIRVVGIEAFTLID